MTPSLLWPAGLPLLLVPPLVWLLLLARDRAKARRILEAVGPRARALADAAPARRKLARAFAAAGLLFALLAVLQPLWGEGDTRIAPRGADVVVCLDVSRSMLARDVGPSRLLAARRAIRALSEHARGDRMALVVFAGEARLVAPLTQDLESFAELVDLADPLLVRGGTDLGAALDVALGALDGSTGDHEAVLLLTDGEDLGRRGTRAAEKCKERGVVVHAVGFGSATGSKIPVENERGGETFLRDRSGREVISALDPAGLRKIANTTGGDYADGGEGGSPLLALYDRRIVPMARKAFEDRAHREQANRYQWPLLLALAAWILELAWSHRRLR